MTDVGTGVYTIADFADGIPRGNARTAEIYRRELGRLEGTIGKPLADASARDLLTVKKKLRDRRAGPYTATIVRMFYRAAARATDEARYLKLADEMRLQQRVRRLSPDDVLTLPEVDAIVQAANGMRDRAFIVALWETGARIHELLAVNLGDVREMDLPGNGGAVAYRVFFRRVKVAGEEHVGYVLDGADHFRAWLRAHPVHDEAAPLFVSWHNTRLGYTGAFNLIRTMAKRALITKRVYPHLFRHSRATHLLRLRVPESHIKRLLGWTPNSSMLARYTHLATHDSYLALLKAHGIESPEPVDVGRLTAAENSLRSVLPMMTPSVAGNVNVEVLAQEVVKAIARETASRPPPAWATPEQYLKTIEQLQERLAVLEARK